jgi:NAD(P)-dependent dehydrogenase (short-subunit alcohol dehydrogenase family)
MTHIAIQEALDGKVVEWMEKLTASAEEFDRVNAINFRRVGNCMKYELRQMREQGSGAIVNCSSTGDLVGIAGRYAPLTPSLLM